MKFITISDLMAYLPDVVDAARAKVVPGSRWDNAIVAAYDRLLQSDQVIMVDDHTLLSPSQDTPGLYYSANGACQCKAAELHQPCRHRAEARLIVRCLEAKTQPAPVAPRTSPELLEKARREMAELFG